MMARYLTTLEVRDLFRHPPHPSSFVAYLRRHGVNPLGRERMSDAGGWVYVWRAEDIAPLVPYYARPAAVRMREASIRRGIERRRCAST